MDQSSELSRIGQKLSEAHQEYLSRKSQIRRQKDKIQLEQSPPKNSLFQRSNLVDQFAQNSNEMFTYLILESIKHNNFVESIEYIKSLHIFKGPLDRTDEHFNLSILIVLLFVCEQIRSKHPSNH